MANNSAPRDGNADRFTDPEGFDVTADPSTERGTTGFGTAPNFDGGQMTPDKRSRNEKVADARDARGVGFGDLDVPPDGSVSARTQETAARTFNAYTATCVASPSAGVYPGDPTLLVGADPQRQRLFISNGHATDPVIIGTLASVQTGQGFILPAGQRFDPQVQDAIYACVPASGTNNITLGVWIESDN